MERVPVRPDLFEPVDDPAKVRLVAGLCSQCHHHHFPAQTPCPYCGAPDCERVRLGRSGTLLVCTTVRDAPPGYGGCVPYGLGIVELPEGIRIVSRIVDPARVTPGTAVELTLDAVGTDEQGRQIVCYAFAAISGR